MTTAAEHCNHCGEQRIADLTAHQMNHAIEERLEIPDSRWGFWDEHGRWNRSSRNW